MASKNFPDDERRDGDHEEGSLLPPPGLQALRRQVGEQLAQSMKPKVEALEFRT